MSAHHGILLHVIFSTKYRIPVLADAWRDDLFAYIGGTVKDHKSMLLKAGGSLGRESEETESTRIPSREATTGVRGDGPFSMIVTWTIPYTHTNTWRCSATRTKTNELSPDSRPRLTHDIASQLNRNATANDSLECKSEVNRYDIDTVRESSSR